jgi:hypothetical protein
MQVQELIGALMEGGYNYGDASLVWAVLKWAAEDEGFLAEFGTFHQRVVKDMIDPTKKVTIE